MRLLIFTLGFDIKFQIRSIIRAGVSSDDEIILIRPADEHEKTIGALKDIEQFIKEYLPDTKYNLIAIDVLDPVKAVAQVSKILHDYENKVDEIICDLSGGMRLLLLEVFMAVLVSQNISKYKIIVQPENLKGFVEIPTELLNVRTPSYDVIKIIKEMGESATLTDLEAKLQIPKITLYKRMKKLVELGYVTEQRIGKKIIYRPKNFYFYYINK